MQLNSLGKAVREAWFELPQHFAGLELDSFVVMPNHVHAVVALADPLGAGLRPARDLKRHGLSQIVGAFKSFSSRRIAELNSSWRGAVWQRSFYDHLIRNGDDLANVRRYILQNPAMWEFDRENPNRKSSPQKQSPLLD